MEEAAASGQAEADRRVQEVCDQTAEAERRREGALEEEKQRTADAHASALAEINTRLKEATTERDHWAEEYRCVSLVSLLVCYMLGHRGVAWWAISLACPWLLLVPELLACLVCADPPPLSHSLDWLMAVLAGSGS